MPEESVIACVSGQHAPPRPITLIGYRAAYRTLSGISAMSPNTPPANDDERPTDAATLGQFIQTRRLQLMAYIRRNLGAALARKVEVDDVLQEITLEALRRVEELKSSDRDPFGWLCQIAEYRLIDIHRHFFGAQKRAAHREVDFSGPGQDSRQTPLVNMLIASMTTPSQAFSRDQKELRLQALLSELPEESRQALQLRYVDGLATKEIAERMGKSDGSIRVLLTRSLQKLQSLLGPEGT